MTDFDTGAGDGDGARELVVLLHGLGSRRLAAVREVIRAEYPHADVLAPSLPISSLSCMVKAEKIVAGIIEAVDRICAQRQGPQAYASITFVGHSFGAVLARKAATIAYGEQADPSGDVPAPFEPEFAAFRAPRPWAGSIRRIVLLAGMNRGWSVSSTMDWWTGLKWGLGQFIGEIFLGGKATIFAIRTGAPFIVQMRLQWLALMDPDYGRRPALTIVQLLGTIDGEVSPDDSVDFAVDGDSSGATQTYYYLQVRLSNHDNVVEMSQRGPEQTATARAERRNRFLLAFGELPAKLLEHSITRAHMADSLPPAPDRGVTDMVFVVHGIRDKGFWTRKIAGTIKRHAGEKRFESWTESYGYFAMLPFLLRRVRQRKVEWLMDRYCEARARYPRARFHYVGHSNGTYLAAKALQDYPAARFTRVVFAGSVVRRDYDWRRLTSSPAEASRCRPRVEKVLNYVATHDWVVAIFPKGVQPLHRFNLGSAGHDGFDQATPSGPVHQLNYIVGSHGIGHEESNWDDIARFIVDGTPPVVSYPPFCETQSGLWRRVGDFSGLLLLGILLGLLALGTKLLTMVVFASTPLAAVGAMAGLLAFVWGLKVVVTRL